MCETNFLLQGKDDMSSQAFVEYRPVASKYCMPCSHCKSAFGEDTTKTDLNLPLFHFGLSPAQIDFSLASCPKLSVAVTHTNPNIGLALCNGSCGDSADSRRLRSHYLAGTALAHAA